jgi:chaperonin GroEL
MGKKIFYKEDARQRLFGGIKMLYDAVAVTYGPQGGNVVIMDRFNIPSITHDGVTVAQSVSVDETEETAGYNVGIELIKDAASKLNTVVGDGTTTVTVLTYHIIEEANKLIADGVKPQQLRKELEKACIELIKTLDTLVEPINDQDTRIAEVATVSAGDREIGQLIASIVKVIGKDGVITVEPGHGVGLEHEIVKGHAINVGYKSPLFVTDPTTKEAIIDQPSIILAKKTIASPNDIVPLLSRLTEKGIKNIVLFAESVKGDALNILLVNKIKGGLNVVVVETEKEEIDDIAVTTGAMVISEATGITAENASLDILGHADKVIVGETKTTIISGKGIKEDIDTYLADIKTQSEKLTGYDKQLLEKRYADISGKAAIIKVGGNSEAEIDEKKYRVDDAVAATKAALEYGIVAGGGTALIHLSNSLESLTNGHKVLKQALLEPFKRITDNAQLDADELLKKVQKAKYGYGIDVLSDSTDLIDLRDHGVIDPYQVTKESLLSSISIASTVITIGAVIVEDPEKA